MAGFNRVVLVGNLTRDPDYRQLASGQGVCRIGLATNRQYKNKKTGEYTQEVCFIDVNVWGPQAESCRQYLQKGRQVLIEGRLKLESWEDQSGQARSKHSIVAESVVFLSSSPSDEVSPRTSAAAPQADLEKELMNQLDEIKASQKTEAPKKAKKQTANSGEIAFKDEQPFTEDLPF